MARDERARAIVVAIFLSLVFRNTMAAPIRAYAAPLWYVPDLFVLIGFGALTYVGARERVIPWLVFTGLFVLLIVYGVVNNPPLDVLMQGRQVAYVVLAAFAGIGVRHGNQLLARAIVVAAAVAIIGIYWDNFFKVPWSGAAFEGALRTAGVARDWSANGVRRLSGFGLASGDTSILISAGAIAMCGLTRNRLTIVSAIFAALAVHTVLLTTQKATAGWLMITLFAAFVTPLINFKREGFASAKFLRVLGMSGLIGCILVPILFSGVRFSELLSVQAPTLDQRMNDVWPVAMSYLLRFPQALLGYGLGAIGEVARVDDLVMIDNMFLFTALLVGIPLALLLFGFTLYAFWTAAIRDAVDYTALALATLLVLNGITANIIASGGVGSMFLGMSFGLLLRPTRRSAPARQRSRRSRGEASAMAEPR
ncbi:hypothetical protein [Sphingomonas sp. BK235]|uniref:hypothetical protein n=1 Tax=Sphingomonas sp. BK235 TaxID=2512131 RepID=UPI0010473305|nr:hypothetical protein [Sphingomonas sp. BK235]